MLFAEHFHWSRCGRSSGDGVVSSFFHAKDNLSDLYDWQTDLEPQSSRDVERLEERKKKYRITTLKIAGTPKIYKRRESAEGAELEEVTEPLPTVGKELDDRRKSLHGDDMLLLETRKIREEQKRGFTGVREDILGLEDRVMDAIDEIMKTIFDVSENTCLRTFVILPCELPQDDENEAKEESKVGAVEARVAKVSGWLSSSTSLVTAVKSKLTSIEDNVQERFDSTLGYLRSNKLYLYLVDEVTDTAARGHNYPIETSVASRKAKRFLPYMSVGLGVLCAADGLVGLARVFFPGVPVPNGLFNPD